MDVGRLTQLAAQEGRKVIDRLWSVFKELFHEVVGFVFFAVALFFIVGQAGLIRTYRGFAEGSASLWQLLLVAGGVAMFAYFGVSSFRRARRISRQRDST